MGMIAENLARADGWTRQQQDAYALSSHRKAVAAAEEGQFLGAGGAAFGAAQMQGFAGVVVEDGQVVVGAAGGQGDEVAHR